MKVRQDTDISTKVIKYNSDIFVNFLLFNFNCSVPESSTFSSILKQTNIAPAFNKGDRNLKDNYTFVSILPTLSKIFERCAFWQSSNFIVLFLSKFQCGFRKGYNTQHCLLAILEKWKAVVAKEKPFAAFLKDLSKAFDWLSHELLFANLHAYDFSISVLSLIYSYATNRKERTKVHSIYSSWK